MRKVIWVIVLVLLAGGVWYYIHSNDDSSGSGSDSAKGSGKHAGGGKDAKTPPVPVGVATAKSGNISVYLQGLGNITPRSTVTVHTLITGQLMEVKFTEGQLVKKDDLLALIDARPYEAVLKQAEGLLTRDEALLAEAKLDYERYKTLWTQDSIAKQQLDTQASLVKQYDGAVKNDQGQVDAAKVNLVYTRIPSPVNGRVGLRQVDAGNIVHSTDTNGLVIVTELQPITSIFTLPEDNIPTVFKHVDSGEKLVAEAWDRDNKNKIATGTLTAIDNQVDATTGTVKFRAEFANEDNALFPSQFVNIRLKLNTLENVVTIPTAAVQRGTKGTFVYLVGADKTVTVQEITLGPAEGENVNVQKGVSVGDQIVIDGADTLRDGSRVSIAAIDNKPTSGKGDDKGDKSAKGDKAAAKDDKTPPADDSAGKKQHKHKKHSDDDSK